jgi:hypothetical protein
MLKIPITSENESLLASSAEPRLVAICRASMSILVILFATATILAAELPEHPIARKGVLLFSDDFARTDLGRAWRVTTPTFTITDGVLKGSHTQASHSAVCRVDLGQKDTVIEFKFRLAGASVNAVCNDPRYKESHGGHICRVVLSPKDIRLSDDKERLRNDILEMQRDPLRKAEAAKLVAGRLKVVPTSLDPGRWYKLCMEIVGDEMRVSLDDKAIGCLKSSGIAHPTKREFYFTVAGKDAFFDDVRIWAASPW